MKKKRIKHDNLSLYVSGCCILFILVFLTNGYSQDIHLAVSEGDLEKVESLLKESPLLVNKEDANGRTPIFTAIIRRNPEMVKLLIDNGALVRVGDSNLRAPIHFAGFNNDTNMIALLLENGAVIDTRAIGAATPLIHSSLINLYELSRFLIEHGADINIQCNSLTTPLYFASLNNNLEYCNYLLDVGADLDTPDFLNRTPLYVAVRDGYKEIVNLLIDRGADFHFRDPYLNRGLLHLASIQGHKEIAEVLIHEGMDVNGKDTRGYTPLDYANRYGHDSTAELLEKNDGRSSQVSSMASADNIEKRDIPLGDAIVIKLQNGSWGIRTRKHFLIFGYSEIGNPPPGPSISNGYITGNEMKDVSWVYFDLGSHPPKAVFPLQGGTPIYSMQDRVEHLSFVLNDAFERYYSGLHLAHSYFPKPGQPLDVEDLKVTVIPSYRNKKGYFIECDDLNLFWLSSLSDDYITSKKDTRAIEFAKENFPDVDLLFLGTPEGIGPEKGNGIREAYLESRRLSPKSVFFMGKEPLERRILYQIRRRIHDPGNILCSENPGDTFHFSQSDISRKIQVNEDLVVEEIEEDVIVATHRFPWAGNCLAVRVSPSELVLVDTPWELTGTDALLQWLQERYGRIHITAVNTHFHQDNLGGNEMLLSCGIPVYGSDLTVRLLGEKRAELIQRTLKNLPDPKYKRYSDAYKNLDLKPPDHVFELKKGLALPIGQEDIEIFYPGPAHTLDNIVVYFHKRKILFGGCMIRSLESTSISPPRDGDLDNWPQSTKNVLDKFPEARIVIPGHGTWGDTRLIQHTIDIANLSLRQSDLPVVKGPCLGQTPPGTTPELFAPEIITEASHSAAVFSEDGSEVFYVPWSTLKMETMKQINGIWTKPRIVSFSAGHDAENPWFTADGTRMYFTSTRPLEAEDLRGKEKFWGENIWYVDRKHGGWSEPVPLCPELNSLDLHWQFSINDHNNDLFLSASSGKNRGESDIYKSAFTNGQYTKPVKLGSAINTQGDEDTPFVATDGSYLIFARKPGADTFADLYVSFRKQDGSWMDAISLGSRINSEAHEVCPVVTRDGKYLFFISMKSGKPQIYWVDAKIIEDLKPKELE